MWRPSHFKRRAVFLSIVAPQKAVDGRVRRGPSSVDRGGRLCYCHRAVAKKKIVEELKHPDQFVDFWTHAWQRTAAFVGPRKKPALALLVAAVVVLVGIIVIDKFEGDKRVTDSAAFEQIQQLATADLTSAADPAADKDAALPARRSTDDVRKFKTIEERQAAVLKDVDQFSASHSGSRLQPEAMLLKGTTLLGGGKFDEAISAYKAALDSKLDGRLRFLAKEGLLYAHEGKGELDLALAEASALIDDSKDFQGFFKERGLYQKARLTERKGDKAGAVKLYREVLEKVSDSPLHDAITDRLALLEAK
jgi:tetratricopeptide (TPR) repeat protein